MEANDKERALQRQLWSLNAKLGLSENEEESNEIRDKMATLSEELDASMIQRMDPRIRFNHEVEDRCKDDT